MLDAGCWFLVAGFVWNFSKVRKIGRIFFPASILNCKRIPSE
jgi:hypothetical protein